MKKSKVLLALLSLTMLVGCKTGTNDGPSGKDPEKVAPENPDDLIVSSETDKLEFAQKDQLEGKKFAGFEGTTYDHMGYVSLRSCTDGDTANFVQEGYVDEFGAYVTIKTRFLGVNTPESTAKVQPWGKKASLFTKHVLEEAQAKADEESAAAGKKVFNIALINSPKTFVAFLKTLASILSIRPTDSAIGMNSPGGIMSPLESFIRASASKPRSLCCISNCGCKSK